ncbi:GntR family transcriptional regulator [Lachnospira pectinoschiza]|uniref:GntR family transcriptional regulator n=2 Tax=Lachnospira pectinoschiza TaxID=28052 RepID=A0A1G9WWM4_9FIRM|nr:GntR family transcriptional regulator [Lachnospira pectinoschiza]
MKGRQRMFIIDAMSRTPVYEQLIEQVETMVLTGVMKAGDKMPSVRSLSGELSINPNTIQKAYAELDRKGLIASVPGKGSFISENAMDIVGNDKREQAADLKDIIGEMKLAGVAKQEIMKIIEEVYG